MAGTDDDPKHLPARRQPRANCDREWDDLITLLGQARDICRSHLSRLGHATIQMTADTYGHLFPRGDDSAEMAAAGAAIARTIPAISQ